MTKFVGATAILTLVAFVAGQALGRRTDARDGGRDAGGKRGPTSMPARPTSRTCPRRSVRRGSSTGSWRTASKARWTALRFFAPMAIQAYQMIGPLDAHARYDIGTSPRRSARPRWPVSRSIRSSPRSRSTCLGWRWGCARRRWPATPRPKPTSANAWSPPLRRSGARISRIHRAFQRYRSRPRQALTARDCTDNFVGFSARRLGGHRGAFAW